MRFLRSLLTRRSYFTAAGRFHRLDAPRWWSRRACDELAARVKWAVGFGLWVPLPRGVRLYAMGAAKEKAKA